MPSIRRAGLVAAVGAPGALAYRFGLVYRARAGFPRRRLPTVTPANVGLPFEEVLVPSTAGGLAGWFVPARDGLPGPGVLVVHGWESGRDRTLPHVRYLHAAGFHVLTLDVRGHGANPPESLPITVGEFAADAAAAFDELLARPEVTSGAIVGHSLGGDAALLAGAAAPRVAAVVSVSAPADPYRLTRLTFRLARLPLPDAIAYPLAALTAHLFVRPRRHGVREVSASVGARHYHGPLLLVHGADDDVVPLAHLRLLEAAARAGRRSIPDASPVETCVVTGAAHSWLFEDAIYRRAVATFLARSLGGPFAPDEAGSLAAEVDARRLPDTEAAFADVPETHRRLRLLLEVLGAPVQRLVVDAAPLRTADPALPDPAQTPAPEVG
ncbi:MAG TPA: alpha/beta fold hydrolase [Candidatus Dormibacteraeota bacterium]|nr:alpha/beta fold hydrolase [Candidatus Dormibacteraeota bacterium]